MTQRRDLLLVQVYLRLLGVSQGRGKQLVGCRPEFAKPQLGSGFQTIATRCGPCECPAPGAFWLGPLSTICHGANRIRNVSYPTLLRERAFLRSQGRMNSIGMVAATLVTSLKSQPRGIMSWITNL